MQSGLPLDLDTLDPEPMRELAAWLAEAEAGQVALPTAFALATADRQATPSVRMLLARGIDLDGVRFYTNRDSRKGRDLAANPRAAATFWWPSLERQARLAGTVRALSDEESSAYWSTRPRASRLSAWASAQGEEIASRAALEARAAEIADRYPGEQIPLPPFWGGYLLTSEVVELWQSRADRLHDRIEYRRMPDGTWRRRRLQP